MKTLALSLFALTLALPAQRTAPWPAAVVERFGGLPIQEDGRVKPISTYAKFQLLQFRSLSGCPTPSGERLSPTEWLLDTLFFPEQSKTYEIFLVNDSAVLDAIGLAHEGKHKRDRYSYADLAPQRGRLLALAREKTAINVKQRTSLEQQIFMLGHNVVGFERLLQALDFARRPAGGRTYSETLARLPELMRELGGTGNDDAHQRLGAEVSAIEQEAALADVLAVLPPTAADAKEWLTPGNLAFAIAAGRLEHAGELALVTTLERLAREAAAPAAFARELDTFAAQVLAITSPRGEGRKLGLEVTFYKLAPFYWSTVLFVLAFLLCAIGWLAPANRWLRRGAGLLVGGATLFLIAGIVLRCILRSRPPVSTLYETILFITAVVVLVALAIEWLNRRRIGLTLAAALGGFGTWLAMRYEEFERADTMPTLQAVLDTNFWLSTHVTSITIGYAAGLLAGAIGHVFLIGKLLRWKRGDDAFYRTLARMVYGVLAFGLFFSVVGTILGGIWANDSWGRFWGWDPKENGALLICLFEIAILHGRMGGYLRQHGVAVASVLNAVVVAFSWWHVNQLGVGLHSYGFTDGVLFWLFSFYGFELLVVALGGYAWWRDRRAAFRAAVPAIAAGA